MRLNHFNLAGGVDDVRDLVAWHNRVQELALATGPGIPVTLSTDPRHSFSNNPGTEALAGAFSKWPQSLGFAALGDADLVQRYADIARQEYLAAGIRVALHPQIDLATEPRWARIGMTFGEDADLTVTASHCLHPRLPGHRARPGFGRHDDQTFPRRGTAAGWRRPALRVRPRAGLPGRTGSSTTSSRSAPRSRPGRRR